MLASYLNQILLSCLFSNLKLVPNDISELFENFLIICDKEVLKGSEIENVLPNEDGLTFRGETFSLEI